MNSNEELTSSSALKRFKFASMTEEMELHEGIPTHSSFLDSGKRKTKRKSSHKVSSEAVDKRQKKEEAKRKREEGQLGDWSYKRGKLASILKDIEPIISYNSIPNPYIKESEMVKEVYELSESEKLEDWIKRTAEMEKNGGWAVDYIICTEPGRDLGQTNFVEHKKWRALIKWSRFPVPTWDLFTLLSGPAIAEFLLRTIYFDYVEIDIREQKSDDYFEEHFKHRYLPFEDRPEEQVYIEDERALYQSKLRAIEHHCTTANAREGRPPLYIADWTDRPFSDAELLDTLVRSAKHLKSLLLRGCTVPILFFRYPGRGWTFRSLTEIMKHKVIAESVREIQIREGAPPPSSMAPSTSRNDMTEDSDSDTDEDDVAKKNAARNAARIMKDLNAYRKEDDLRYMHHQCEPNTYYETKIMNSDDGRIIQHAAVHAARDIKRGEELSFDRYEGKVPRMLHQEGMDVFDEFLPDGCPCLQPNCRFTVKLINKFRRYLKANEEDKEKADCKLTRMEEQGDAYKSSSDEDDEGEVVANGGHDNEEEEKEEAEQLESAAAANALDDNETGAGAAVGLKDDASRGTAGSDAE